MDLDLGFSVRDLERWNLREKAEAVCTRERERERGAEPRVPLFIGFHSHDLHECPVRGPYVTSM